MDGHSVGIAGHTIRMMRISNLRLVGHASGVRSEPSAGDSESQVEPVELGGVATRDATLVFEG